MPSQIVFKVSLVLIASFSLSAFATDMDLNQFCKKYGVSQNQLVQLEKKYLDSDFGLKHLGGLRLELGEYTKKEISATDLIDFAELFSLKVNSLAQSRLEEFGGGFGLKQKDYDQALDEGLDDVDGKKPQQFLEKLAKSLMKSAHNPKLTYEKATMLARALQIRMDIVMMKPHLKDEEYMRRLLGEKTFEKIRGERMSRPGGVL